MESVSHRVKALGGFRRGLQYQRSRASDDIARRPTSETREFSSSLKLAAQAAAGESPARQCRVSWAETLASPSEIGTQAVVPCPAGNSCQILVLASGIRCGPRNRQYASLAAQAAACESPARQCRVSRPRPSRVPSGTAPESSKNRLEIVGDARLAQQRHEL